VAFGFFRIAEQTCIHKWVLHSDRNMHFEPAYFTSFTKRILKNSGIQKTVNATAPFGMGSLDIKGFEGQKFLNAYLLSS